MRVNTTRSTHSSENHLGTLLVLVGPTASGKTGMAINLAESLGCEIISADSRQVFRELTIGSAAPTLEERHRVKHHLVQCHSVTERYSAGQYEVEALAIIERQLQEKGIALLTGGSMLYIDAVCKGLDQFPVPDPALRQQLNLQLLELGVDSLCEKLREVDPASWATVDRKNGARVLRALEVTLQTGRPYSQFLRGEPAQRPFRIVKLGLQREAADLRARIESRTHKMLALGLVPEVESLLPHRELPSLRTVGYREIFQYLDGKCSLEQATTDIITHTWRYAKRQLTWWQRDPHIEWMRAEDIESLVARAHQAINTRG